MTEDSLAIVAPHAQPLVTDIIVKGYEHLLQQHDIALQNIHELKDTMTKNQDELKTSLQIMEKKLRSEKLYKKLSLLLAAVGTVGGIGGIYYGKSTGQE